MKVGATRDAFFLAGENRTKKNDREGRNTDVAGIKYVGFERSS
jgi:hypothetical protein